MIDFMFNNDICKAAKETDNIPNYFHLDRSSQHLGLNRKQLNIAGL